MVVAVGKPAVPACPLTVTDPPVSETRHLDAIGEQTLSEVKVIHLYPMLAGRHAIDNALLIPPQPPALPE